MTHLLEGPMPPLRRRMIEDMVLAGLARGTQEAYLSGVRGLAARHRQSPDHLTEEQVRSYLLELRERGVARGTFKTSHYGIRFLYQHTLGYDWELFGKKRSRSPSRSGFPMLLPIQRPGVCLARFAIPSIGAAFP
ncbi:MAG: site-specific integrase [Rhodospirillaceae bacterium]